MGGGAVEKPTVLARPKAAAKDGCVKGGKGVVSWDTSVRCGGPVFGAVSAIGAQEARRDPVTVELVAGVGPDDIKTNLHLRRRHDRAENPGQRGSI